MKGGKEVHGTLILLGFLDPTHYSPMVLLTGTWRVPTSLGGRAKEKKNEGQKPRDSKFWFNLKISNFFPSKYPCSRLSNPSPSTPTRD